MFIQDCSGRLLYYFLKCVVMAVMGHSLEEWYPKEYKRISPLPSPFRSPLASPALFTSIIFDNMIGTSIERQVRKAVADLSMKKERPPHYPCRNEYYQVIYLLFFLFLSLFLLLFSLCQGENGDTGAISLIALFSPLRFSLTKVWHVLFLCSSPPIPSSPLLSPPLPIPSPPLLSSPFPSSPLP